MRPTPRDWELASRYMRSYARASHWKVTKLQKMKGYALLEMYFSPPKKRKSRRGRDPRPASQKTEEQK